MDYYTRHIGENPDWELADIYADEGISGLDTRKRDEFNRMMADCRAGKIDRILVKCQRHFKMSIFAEMGCRFLQGSIQVLYSLIHHITCRFEARQALIYQLASGLTGENGKYNYSKAVHLYPPFFDIFCSPKNYKTASALTPR